MKNLLAIIIIIVSIGTVKAQLKRQVGKKDFSDWSGIVKVHNEEATIKNGKTISYRYSGMNRKYPGLMRNFYGDAADWSDYKGISFELFLNSNSPVEVKVSFKVDALDVESLNPVSTAKIQIVGQGWKSIYIPWDMFNVNVGQKWAALQAVKDLEITVNSKKGQSVKIKNIFVSKGESLALQSKIQGKSAKAGEKVIYSVNIGNTTNTKQSVQLLIEKYGWESMTTSIIPSNFELEPGEIKNCDIEVVIPKFLPEGIREKQILKAIPNGKGASAETIKLITAVAVPTPNIVFTIEKWEEIRDKIKNYDWAKEALAEYEKKATNWDVPHGAPLATFPNSNEMQPIFTKGEGDDIMECAITYQLTGKTEYANKCLKLLRRLVNEENGYPVTLHGGGDSFVAEGVFFQGVARAYDMIRNSDIFTQKDHELIEKTFRLFINRTIKGNTRGGISNWNVAELTAALYCALNLQDWHLVNKLLNSPSGIYNQITHGVMSDGWWYECAVGYNLWVAREFSEIAIALEPWGLNIKDKKFPIGTTPHFSLNPNRRKAGLHGMDFMKWGTILNNSVGIKDMWDAVIPFLDYRGVLPAVNDAKEDIVTGKPYELAYYLYRDPEYAAVINRGTKRHLLYGVPELPNVKSKKMKQSAFADNLGLVQLRSQTKEREQSEQIQAALHYGSHGGHHGHFDRTNLISMMRYGRSFYNPEMYWYGYSSYLYKFLVQTSINKNMVVVDEKMQEPKESFRTMYYTGDMLQATAVETKARWSYPPYGGMIYSSQHDIDFPEKMWKDARSIAIPKERPKYGECTDYTEPILQRRLMIIMDDYVILSDYLKAEKEHTFDWLMQVKGFKGIKANKKSLSHHDAQWNKDPLGSSQFITDCNWYETKGTPRTSFEMCWGKNCDNKGARMPFSENGPLKIDVFNAWPKENKIMIGTAPESFSVNKKLWYTIEADNKTIVNDSTGVWVLGSKSIDVNIEGAKKLILRTNTEKRVRNNTIFWGDAKLILKNGSEVYISSLPITYDNIRMPNTKGLDYYNGPIKIAGELMSNSIPGMPANTSKKGMVTIDISDMDVVAFKAKLGGDFPLGDETQRRKTMAVRSKGKRTRYLSVIEPYETKSVIKSVTAKSENQLVVELLDGRTQEITISNIESETEAIVVNALERKNGEIIRQERTK